MPTQADIEREILAGLPNERQSKGAKGAYSRLEQARRNALAYRGDFTEDFIEWQYPRRSQRSVLLVRRVLELLTQHLYRKPPERTVPPPEDREGEAADDTPYTRATAALQTIYQANGLDPLMIEADRLALLNEVSAIEVLGTIGEEAFDRPVTLYLWGGEDLVVWLDEDDARKPFAVATVDMYDNRRRLRLWTAEQRVTFETAKWSNYMTSGGTAYREVERIANPYGVLPFAFVHAQFPARWFWSGGIGDALTDANYHLNHRLTVAADDILHNRPKGVIEGASSTFNFPEKQRAGEFITIPALADAGGNMVSDPRASYITCDFSYLGSDQEDLNQYLETALDMLGIPRSAIRMEQTGTQSGVALVAEQMPLIQWAEQRQPLFSRWERALAKLVFRVATIHAQLNGMPDIAGATPDDLATAIDEPIRVKWHKPQIDLPGPERDAADQWLLDNRMASRTRLLMDRYGFTEDEAEAYLKEIAEQLTEEQQLFSALDAAQMAQMSGMGPAPGMEQPDPEALDQADPENEAEDPESEAD